MNVQNYSIDTCTYRNPTSVCEQSTTFLGRFRDDGFVTYDGTKEEILVGVFF